jgi:hypothetical protein
MGCVCASYKERYWATSRSLLVAIAIGILFALLGVHIMGWMAARPWPHWYGAFAHTHKHLALQLWFTLKLLPIALIAAACGALLAHASRSASVAFPVVSLAVWQIYLLADNFLSAPAICPFSFRSLWESFALTPVSSIIGIVLPACALVLGFRLIQIRMRGIVARRSG